MLLTLTLHPQEHSYVTMTIEATSAWSWQKSKHPAKLAGRHVGFVFVHPFAFADDYMQYMGATKVPFFMLLNIDQPYCSLCIIINPTSLNSFRFQSIPVRDVVARVPPDLATAMLSLHEVNACNTSRNRHFVTRGSRFKLHTKLVFRNELLIQVAHMLASQRAQIL